MRTTPAVISFPVKARVGLTVALCTLLTSHAGTCGECLHRRGSPGTSLLLGMGWGCPWACMWANGWVGLWGAVAWPWCSVTGAGTDGPEVGLRWIPWNLSFCSSSFVDPVPCTVQRPWIFLYIILPAAQKGKHLSAAAKLLQGHEALYWLGQSLCLLASTLMKLFSVQLRGASGITALSVA